MEDMKQKRREAWDSALGWAEMDGHTYSPEYLELVEREINGEITM